MKKEQQDRLARSATPPYYSPTSGYAPRGRGAYNAYRGGPQRGGYAYGGRGAASYHPYQRPPPSHGPTKFKNHTVVFNKPDTSAEASGTDSVSAPGSAPLSTAHSRQNSPSPTEPKQLCATFTSTGTLDSFDARIFSFVTPLTSPRHMHAPWLPSPSRSEQAGALQALALQKRLQSRRPLFSVARAYPSQRSNLSALPRRTVHERGLSVRPYPCQSCSPNL